MTGLIINYLHPVSDGSKNGLLGMYYHITLLTLNFVLKLLVLRLLL